MFFSELPLVMYTILGIIKLDILVQVFQLVAPLLSWNGRKTNFSEAGNFSSLKIMTGENNWFKLSCILVKQRIVSLFCCPNLSPGSIFLNFWVCLRGKEGEPVWCWSRGSSQSHYLIFIALQIASRIFHALTAVLAECRTGAHIAALALEEAGFFFWTSLREIALECYSSIRMTEEEWRSHLNCRHSYDTSSSQICLLGAWYHTQPLDPACKLHPAFAFSIGSWAYLGMAESHGDRRLLLWKPLSQTHMLVPPCACLLAEQILMQFEKDMVISWKSQVFSQWRI